jgi:hypothetical protein
MGGGRVEPLGRIALPLLVWIAGSAQQLQQAALRSRGAVAGVVMAALSLAALAMVLGRAARQRRLGAVLRITAVFGAGSARAKRRWPRCCNRRSQRRRRSANTAAQAR